MGATGMSRRESAQRTLFISHLLLMAACDGTSPASEPSTQQADAAQREQQPEAGKTAPSKREDAGQADAGKDSAVEKNDARDAASGDKNKDKAGAAGATDAAGGKAGGKAGAAGSGADKSSMDVTVRFVAKVGDIDFSCGSTYEMLGTKSSSVTPQDLRLFIQDLALIADDGVRTKVVYKVLEPWQSETVALLDFEDASGSCSGTEDVNTEIVGTLEARKYKGLSFVVGVPEELNHADPTRVHAPLMQSAALAWSWLSGFRFAKIELLNTDLATDGQVLFHPGAQECTGDPMAGGVKCAKSNRTEVVLDAFDPSTESVVIDIAALFAQTDLSSDSQCHASEQAACEPMFAAWGLQFPDGKPKSGQSVFKKQLR